MRKNLLLLLILAGLALGACTTPRQAESPAIQSPEETASVEPEEVEAPTAPPAPPTEEKATAAPSAVDSPVSGEPMACTVTGGIIQPNPTITAMFPAVGENDWVIGKSDAAVTFVEYGDFQ